MIEYKNYADSNIVEISVQGYVTEADFDTAIAQFKDDFERHGKLRVLEEIQSFEGLDPITLWKDIRFGLAHVNKITHAAVVADAKWMRTFAEATNSVLTAKIKAFEPSQVEAARIWLSAVPNPSQVSAIEYRSSDESNIVEVVIEGKITTADFNQLISLSKADITKHGKLKVLEEIRSFEGIEPMALWQDLQQVALAEHFTHAAIVTDVKWIQTLAAASDAIFPMKIKVFSPFQLEEARTWLANV